VCGAPPPSSGGIAIAQMLGMLEIKDIAPYKPVDGQLTAQGIHLFSEAGRLAYADRNRYVADPDFVPLPGKGVAALLDKGYLAQRAALIGERSMGRAAYGTPDTHAGGMGRRHRHRQAIHLAPGGGGRLRRRPVDDHLGGRRLRRAPDGGRLHAE
jgi:gamma-glutamyltranspeptidase/glutathione hydrolase